jgi:hypothetical protein
MSWLTIFNEIFSVAWLIAVLYFLWRHAIGGASHVHRLHMLLNDNASKSAQAALESAQAARIAAEAVTRAIAILEAGQRKDSDD